MPRKVISVVVKLFLVSLAVGYAMAYFDLTPQSILEFLGAEAQDVAEVGSDLVVWSWPYVLLGAGVVLPLWGLKFLWGRARSGNFRLRK